MPTNRLSTDDIVREVASVHDLTLKESKAIVNTVFKFIKETVAGDNQVSISKFGAFEAYKSKAYTARNPQTGAPVKVAAKKRIKFRPFEAFKKCVAKV